MLLDYRNTSFEVKEAKPDLALLPIGGVEPQGPHLPVGAMNFILDALAREVASRLRGTVYLLPTLPLGTSEAHWGLPGAVALEWSTLMDVVYDLVEALVRGGIRRVAVLNGLGGTTETTVCPRENYIVKTAVRQLNYDIPELDAIWVQPFTVAAEDLRKVLESADEDIHAGELATSLMLYLAPQWVKGPGPDHVPDDWKGLVDFTSFQSLCPDGVWGRPSLASAEKGERAFAVAVERTVQYIEETFAHLARMKKRHYTQSVQGKTVRWM